MIRRSYEASTKPTALPVIAKSGAQALAMVGKLVRKAGDHVLHLDKDKHNISASIHDGQGHRNEHEPITAPREVTVRVEMNNLVHGVARRVETNMKQGKCHEKQDDHAHMDDRVLGHQNEKMNIMKWPPCHEKLTNMSTRTIWSTEWPKKCKHTARRKKS